MSSSPWNRASALPAVVSGRPRPEIASLPAGEPDLATLFTFMRDAELRFDSLRMRIVETTMTARGEHVVNMDVVLRHVGLAKVTTSEPQRGVTANYEIWIGDDEGVRTFSAPRKLATDRPARSAVAGFAGREARDLPGRSRFYQPLTPLPMESLPDTFVHPAGYLQNVIATGACRIDGSGRLLERETVGVTCDHPRTSEVYFDRPDVQIRLIVDRETGVILRLVERVGDVTTRDAVVTDFGPDARLPESAFDFKLPADARMLY